MQYTNQANAINKFNRRFSVAPSTSPKLQQSMMSQLLKLYGQRSCSSEAQLHTCWHTHHIHSAHRWCIVRWCSLVYFQSCIAPVCTCMQFFVTLCYCPIVCPLRNKFFCKSALYSGDTVTTPQIISKGVIIRPGKLDLSFRISACFFWDLPPQLPLSPSKPWHAHFYGCSTVDLLNVWSIW